MSAEPIWGTIDYLVNAFTPDRPAVWDGAIAATGVAVKVRRDETDSFAAPEVMVARMDELGVATILLPTGDLGRHGQLDPFDFEHIAARWEEVAERCLSCGNCTMVCPTCFCTTVEDVTDLEGEHVERHQRWDSCFTVDYSHIHGGAVRGSTRSRYRQWMTHKLATWWDQFDSSGCVGCGRCITWCPVGIDLTEEARAIRASEGQLDEGA